VCECVKAAGRVGLLCVKAAGRVGSCMMLVIERM